MGPEGLALGGALVAGKNRTDFLYANPAAPASEKRYTLGARYTSAGDNMGASIADTVSSPLGGAISFYRRDFKDVAASEDASLGNFNRLENQATIALMTQIAENVSLGVSGRYHYIRPVGALPSKTYWSGDVGVIVQLSPQWRFGIAGQDLLPDDVGYSYKSFSLGLEGMVTNQLTVMAQVDFVRAPEGTADTGFVEDSPGANFRGAVEFAVTKELALRGSYSSLTSWNTNYVGFGLAYKKDKFSLDYGMRVAPDSSKSLIHALGISVDI